MSADALYALVQRLGANGMAFAPSGGAFSLAGAASATERRVFVRGPTLGPVREEPARLPRDLPPTWPTVAEMLIAARAYDLLGVDAQKSARENR